MTFLWCVWGLISVERIFNFLCLYVLFINKNELIFDEVIKNLFIMFEKKVIYEKYTYDKMIIVYKLM